MGRIFKTPGDDAAEQTMRAMHLANEIDTAYERGMGWLKVLIFSTVAAFTVSAFELHTDWNLWQATGDWFSDWLRRQLEKLV